MKKLTKTNSDLVRLFVALMSLVVLCAVCLSSNSATLHAIGWSMLCGSLTAFVGGFAMSEAERSGVHGSIAIGLLGGACMAVTIALYITILVLLTTSATLGLVVTGWCLVAYTSTKLMLIGYKKFSSKSRTPHTHAW